MQSLNMLVYVLTYCDLMCELQIDALMRKYKGREGKLLKLAQEKYETVRSETAGSETARNETANSETAGDETAAEVTPADEAATAGELALQRTRYVCTCSGLYVKHRSVLREFTGAVPAYCLRIYHNRRCLEQLCCV
jgi:hypothetical protein